MSADFDRVVALLRAVVPHAEAHAGDLLLAGNEQMLEESKVVALSVEKAKDFLREFEQWSSRETRSCGCRRAGIMLNVETLKIERCDECDLFDTDDDASAAVETLLVFLGETHEAGTGTVADALDQIQKVLTDAGTLRLLGGRQR